MFRRRKPEPIAAITVAPVYFDRGDTLIFTVEREVTIQQMEELKAKATELLETPCIFFTGVQLVAVRTDVL